MKCNHCGGTDHEPLTGNCLFRAATTAELAMALGKPKEEAEKIERGVNAILRRGEMKIVNDSTDGGSNG